MQVAICYGCRSRSYMSFFFGSGGSRKTSLTLPERLDSPILWLKWKSNSEKSQFECSHKKMVHFIQPCLIHTQQDSRLTADTHIQLIPKISSSIKTQRQLKLTNTLIVLLWNFWGACSDIWPENIQFSDNSGNMATGIKVTTAAAKHKSNI